MSTGLATDSLAFPSLFPGQGESERGTRACAHLRVLSVRACLLLHPEHLSWTNLELGALFSGEWWLLLSALIPRSLPVPI